MLRFADVFVIEQRTFSICTRRATLPPLEFKFISSGIFSLDANGAFIFPVGHTLSLFGAHTRTMFGGVFSGSQLQFFMRCGAKFFVGWCNFMIDVCYREAMPGELIFGGNVYGLRGDWVKFEFRMFGC